MDYKKLRVTILLIVGAVSVMCVSFIYIHWIAYRVAAQHIDYVEVVPPVIMCIVMFPVFVLSVKKRNKRLLYKYLAIFLLIIMVGSVITALFSIRAYCPICNNVDDKWYPVFYRLFKGTVYEPL